MRPVTGRPPSIAVGKSAPSPVAFDDTRVLRRVWVERALRYALDADIGTGRAEFVPLGERLYRVDADRGDRHGSSPSAYPSLRKSCCESGSCRNATSSAV